jgi:hypothetical protein
MNTRSWQDRHRLQIRIQWYNNAYYLDQIRDLEQILLREPDEVELELIGTGDFPADTALVLRSALMTRQPKTRIITNARSSLQHAAVLVWLLGDERYIRDDARLFFRRATHAGDDDDEKADGWKDQSKSCESDADPEEADYERVLQLINEYLPVSELAGRLIDIHVLRQFGLVENKKVDGFLATVFGPTPKPEQVPAHEAEIHVKEARENPSEQLNK